MFEYFDPKPLGAASLAQVHKVKLKDGRTIALKVQHPTVKSNSAVDLKTMEVSIIYFIFKQIFQVLNFELLMSRVKSDGNQNHIG